MRVGVAAAGAAFEAGVSAGGGTTSIPGRAVSLGGLAATTAGAGFTSSILCIIVARKHKRQEWRLVDNYRPLYDGGKL